MGSYELTDIHRAAFSDSLYDLLVKHCTARQRFYVARNLLQNLVEEEAITYGNFEAAQAAERHIKAACREIAGIR